VIELLGVGVTDARGRWLLHRVCARLFAGRMVAVVSSRPEERAALLDAVSARVVPEEGRAWVGGVPVMDDTARRVRELVAEVDLAFPAAAEKRSVLWNTLAAAGARRHGLAGLLRVPRRSELRDAELALESAGLRGRGAEPVWTLTFDERARLALARALAQRPECLLVRDPEATLGEPDAERLLGRARALAGRHRLLMIAALGSLDLARRVADRLLVVADGALVFDGPPEALDGRSARGRLAAVAEIAR